MLLHCRSEPTLSSQRNHSPKLTVSWFLQAEVEATMAEQGVPPVIHPQPFYGNPADVPERPTVIAGVQFRVPSSALGDLRPFGAGNARGTLSAVDVLQSSMARAGHRPMSTGKRPPPMSAVTLHSAGTYACK